VGDGRWVQWKRVHLGNAGQGVNRKRVHLGNAGRGVNRQRLQLGNYGQGVFRRRPQGGRDKVVIAGSNGVYDWFEKLSQRLKNVRVCCGDWSRVCGPTPTTKLGLTAVFLDPPYGEDANRANNLYTSDSLSVAEDVRRWAVEHGDDKKIRIALCGYEGEHNMPDTWDCIQWKAKGGYGYSEQGQKNTRRERIWFSPHCETDEQLSMLDMIK
jgi:hypothetical protein